MILKTITNISVIIIALIGAISTAWIILTIVWSYRWTKCGGLDNLPDPDEDDEIFTAQMNQSQETKRLRRDIFNYTSGCGLFGFGVALVESILFFLLPSWLFIIFGIAGDFFGILLVVTWFEEWNNYKKAIENPVIPAKTS